MKDRIILLLKDKGLSAIKFAEIMEVQASSISHITSGRNKPNFDFIAKLLERFPDVNPDWLILGQGSMYRSSSVPTPVQESDHDLFSTPLKEINHSSTREKFTTEPLVFNNANKKVERVIIFFSDKTFIEYLHE